MTARNYERNSSSRSMAKKAGWEDVRIDIEPLGFAAWVRR
jgi:hypothetical protein